MAAAEEKHTDIRTLVPEAQFIVRVGMRACRR
jgi:hypothetical protein